MWLNNNSDNNKNRDNTIDLEYTLKKVIVQTLGETILGINNFPPDTLGLDTDNTDNVTFDGFIELLDQLDEALNLMNIDRLRELEPIMMQKYSKWIYQHNSQTINTGVIPHLIHNIAESNIGNILVITTNLTKLIYLSVIFFSTHIDELTRLKQAINNSNNDYIKRIYMELSRLYIVTDIPRYISKDITIANIQFKAGTMFNILGRTIRMDPKIFPEPTLYNPDRFLENSVNGDTKMNGIELFPFGIGPRQYPHRAASSRR